VTLEERAFRKAIRRLIPFLFLIYVVAYLDRVNVSFAQLQLEDDLDFSDTIFGLGAGIFSLGYVLAGVPSNLALDRFGARRWLALIMIVWGLLSASTMFIGGPVSFYVLRFLLGVAEAGFFPGIILYLTWWFPERERARTLAPFLTAISAAYVAGGPVSGGLLELDGLAGLDGWQWLFLVEGLPAIALGVVTLRFLDDRPADAEWLQADERRFLEGKVARERALREATGNHRLGDALRSGQVWLLGLIYFILLATGFGLTFFVPDLVQDRTGYSDFEVGVLAAIPYGIATATMLLIARRADRAPSRRPYLTVLALVGAAGAALTAQAQSPLLLVVAITLAAVGLLSAIPVFWAFPTAFLSGTAAAAGIALIAAVGNLGGFAGPAFTGVRIRQADSSCR
jgi:MFS transporter, ACS family, tartrate transporter